MSAIILSVNYVAVLSHFFYVYYSVASSLEWRHILKLIEQFVASLASVISFLQTAFF